MRKPVATGAAVLALMLAGCGGFEMPEREKYTCTDSKGKVVDGENCDPD